MLYRYGNQGACTLGQVCPPWPWRKQIWVCTLKYSFETRDDMLISGSFSLTWVLQNPCWDEGACDWGHTETPQFVCLVSHTLSTAEGPHPIDVALAAPGSAQQMVELPPPQTLSSVSEGYRLPPGWDIRHDVMMKYPPLRFKMLFFTSLVCCCNFHNLGLKR